MSTAEAIIVIMLGISLLITLGMCASASHADRVIERRTYRSRRAMPDGSRDVEANNDAAQTVPHTPAPRHTTGGRGGSNP